MTSYVTPKKGFPFICYVGLVSQSTGQFQSNPTLAAGDFKISKDGGALSNLATLPAVTPASSKSVKISLDSDETNADNLFIIGSDAVGAEWDDIAINIQTTVKQIDDLLASVSYTAPDNATILSIQTDTNDIQSRLPTSLSGDGFIKADMKSIDDELTNGNNASLKLKTLNIINGLGDAIFAQGVGGAGIALASDQSGFRIDAATGVFIESSNGQGIQILSDTETAIGLYAAGNGHGIDVQGFGTGKSINAPQGIYGSDSEDLSVTNIVNKDWDEPTAGHTTAGTTGKALTDAGSAGDPWSTPIPGAYGAGTAGYILGNDIDATISSRFADSDFVTPPTAIENAETLLKYDWTSITGEAARSVINALRKLRNKVSFSTGTLSIKKEDDATNAYTQAVTQDSDQEPFKSVG